MVPIPDLLLFIVTVFILIMSPGPNMIYLISRSLVQGKKAGFLSIAGVASGFLFHIVLVSFGLTAILMTIPYAYMTLKVLGVTYLLYLSIQAFKPNAKGLFDVDQQVSKDSPRKLFTVGFLTNALNPKVAVFYVSLFPQFIKPEAGSVLIQNLELGLIQIVMTFSVHTIIVLSVSKIAVFFSNNPTWLKYQRWFMGSVLCTMAIKMAFTKAK